MKTFATEQDAIDHAFRQVGEEGDGKFVEVRIQYLDKMRSRSPRHGERVVVAGRKALLQTNIADLR